MTSLPVPARANGRVSTGRTAALRPPAAPSSKRPNAIVQLTAASEPLVDAAGLAAVLGVSRDYVYAHAGELGAIRLGTGPRPRMRFDPARALDVLAARSRSESSQPSERPAHGAPEPLRRRRARPGARDRAPGARTAAGAPLLPIVGEAPSWD